MYLKVKSEPCPQLISVMGLCSYILDSDLH